MESGKALTPDKAAAIKNLIARAVKGMNFTSVSVFDAETMMEIGDNSADESGLGGAKDLTALTSLIENNIGANVRRVLEKLYGQGNVAVSVKGTLNMEKLIQENTQYSTPDKIDEQDKTGLLHKEDVVMIIRWQQICLPGVWQARTPMQIRPGIQIMIIPGRWRTTILTAAPQGNGCITQ